MRDRNCTRHFLFDCYALQKDAKYFRDFRAFHEQFFIKNRIDELTILAENNELTEAKASIAEKNIDAHIANIKEGAKDLAETEGIFAAPEGAATLAALKELIKQKWVQPDEHVVIFNTGSGLKYLD